MVDGISVSVGSLLGQEDPIFDSRQSFVSLLIFSHLSSSLHLLISPHLLTSSSLISPLSSPPHLLTSSPHLISSSDISESTE
jgi:hypothetical protein